MRFLVRAFWGGIVLALCVGAVALGAVPFATAFFSEEEKTDPRGPRPERILTVEAITPKRGSYAPELVAYGTLTAAKRLEVRAATVGRIIDLSGAMVEGARVPAGEVLARVDPADSQSRSDDAAAALADARSRLAEAQQAVEIGRAEIRAAQEQERLRQTALLRQQDLAQRRIAAQTTVEAAALSLSAARQTRIARQQAQAAAERRVEQARLAVDRAALNVDTAARDMTETQVRAPFAGVIGGVQTTLGRLVTVNEQLATLTDLTSLEARFRLSDTEFARLIDETGALRPLTATVATRFGDRREIAVDAVLDRVASETASEGGRTLFARLSTGPDTPLRPGDFVEVRVNAPALDDAYRLPARAVAKDGTVLIITAEGRIDAITAEILHRGAEATLIAADPDLFGEAPRIIAERRPQLGPGLRVQTTEEAENRAPSARPGA